MINPFARGSANIALRTGADILPVVLRVVHPGLTKQDPWYEIPRRTIQMQVETGASIAHLRYDAESGGDARMRANSPEIWKPITNNN